MITVREFYTTLIDEYTEDKLTQEEFDKIADSGIVPRRLVEEILDLLKGDIESLKECTDDYAKGIHCTCTFYKDYIESLLKKFEEEEEKND